MHAAVAISGLPGSGKSTLASALGARLAWPIIDKDDFLERLLDQAGSEAGAYRRELSREADVHFERAALATDRAILVSFWHVAGMRPDSGTRTEWLTTAAVRVCWIYCECAPAVAAARFLARARHPGHSDVSRDATTLSTEFAALAQLGRPGLGDCLSVRTDGAIDMQAVARAVLDRLAGA